MKQSPIAARREYREAYRELRLNRGVPYETDKWCYANDARDCAILSYDEYDSYFSGWINRQRMSKFHACQRHINLLGWLPF